MVFDAASDVGVTGAALPESSEHAARGKSKASAMSAALPRFDM